MKITVPTAKPRNPCVAAMRARQAGVHQRSSSGQRQQLHLALRQELVWGDDRYRCRHWP